MSARYPYVISLVGVVTGGGLFGCQDRDLHQPVVEESAAREPARDAAPGASSGSTGVTTGSSSYSAGATTGLGLSESRPIESDSTVAGQPPGVTGEANNTASITGTVPGAVSGAGPDTGRTAINGSMGTRADPATGNVSGGTYSVIPYPAPAAPSAGALTGLPPGANPSTLNLNGSNPGYMTQGSSPQGQVAPGGNVATNMNGTRAYANYGRPGSSGQVDAANPNGTSWTVNPNDVNGPAVPGNVQATSRYGTFNPDATLDELEPGDADLMNDTSSPAGAYDSQQVLNPDGTRAYQYPFDYTGTMSANNPPQRYGTFDPDATIDELEPGNLDPANVSSGTSGTGLPSGLAPDGADVSRNAATQAARAGSSADGSDVSRSTATQAARGGNIPSGADVSRTSATSAARSGMPASGPSQAGVGTTGASSPGGSPGR